MYDHQTKTAGCGRVKGIPEAEKRNLGFCITVNLENIHSQNICICFRGRDIQKIYKIDVKKLKRENTGFYQQMKLLSLEKQTEKPCVYKRKRNWKIFPICEKLSA